MVINCDSEIEGKLKKIRMVIDAASQCLDIREREADDIQNILREGYFFSHVRPLLKREGNGHKESGLVQFFLLSLHSMKTVQ